jgi:hypothetical protein
MDKMPRGLALDSWGTDLCDVCELPANTGKLGRFYFIVGNTPDYRRIRLVQVHGDCSAKVTRAPEPEYRDWVFHVLAQLYDVRQGYRL